MSEQPLFHLIEIPRIKYFQKGGKQRKKEIEIL